MTLDKGMYEVYSVMIREIQLSNMGELTKGVITQLLTQLQNGTVELKEKGNT